MRFDLGYEEWPISRYNGGWRQNEKSGRYWIPDYMSGSDYSGSLLEVNNVAVFRDTFPDGEDQWWCEVSGGFGTFAIVVDTTALPEDAREWLDSLESYPSIDDESLSALEIEAQNEAWKDSVCREFVQCLDKRLSAEFEASAEPEDFGSMDEWIARWKTEVSEGLPEDPEPPAIPDDVDQDMLSEIFYQTANRICEYWRNEQGSDVSINVKKIAAAVTAEDLNSLLGITESTAEDSKQLSMFQE